MLRIPNKILAAIVGLLWFLYLPNTIYIFTDLDHLIEQWGVVDFVEKIILLMQYTVLEVIGLWCFLVAFYPVEVILRKLQFSSTRRIISIIGINFLLGFAMVLGKVERVNSWDVFLNQQFVFSSIVAIVTSLPMLGLILLFGLFANFFYFLFRKKSLE